MLFYCICYVKDQTDGDKNEKRDGFSFKTINKKIQAVSRRANTVLKFNLSQHFCTVKEMVFIVTLKMIMLKRHCCFYAGLTMQNSGL